MDKTDIDYYEENEYENEYEDEEKKYVIARRFNNYTFFEVNIDVIDGIQWVDFKHLNGKYTKLGYYIMKGTIDYDLAVELGMASGFHSHRNNGANIYMYKCDNQGETKKNYKELCKVAGIKPSKRNTKKKENKEEKSKKKEKD